MKIKFVVLTLSIWLGSSLANATEVCGIQLQSKEATTVRFAILKGADLSVVSKADSNGRIVRYEKKGGTLLLDGKPAAGVNAELGSTIYVSDGTTRGCVVRMEEKEGRKVLYIEELFFAPKQEPRIETALIEID